MGDGSKGSYSDVIKLPVIACNVVVALTGRGRWRGEGENGCFEEGADVHTGHAGVEGGVDGRTMSTSASGVCLL